MELKFRVSWSDDSGVRSYQPFNTKIEVKHFIEGLKLLGVSNWLKEYYNPHIGDWYSYHSDKE